MDTKTLLLDSAEEAARRYGFDGFSYADLAKDVGVRKASIHHHFPSKADLSLAMLQRYRTRIFEELNKITEKHVLAAAQLKAYLGLYWAALANGEMLCLCVSFSLSSDSLRADVLSELNRFHDDNKGWLADVFARAKTDGSISDVGNIKDEAAACLALAEGAQIAARASKSVADFNSAIRPLKRRLKSG